jgi:hypothetical protein
MSAMRRQEYKMNVLIQHAGRSSIAEDDRDAIDPRALRRISRGLRRPVEAALQEIQEQRDIIEVEMSEVARSTVAPDSGISVHSSENIDSERNLSSHSGSPGSVVEEVAGLTSHRPIVEVPCSEPVEEVADGTSDRPIVEAPYNEPIEAAVSDPEEASQLSSRSHLEYISPNPSGQEPLAMPNDRLEEASLASSEDELVEAPDGEIEELLRSPSADGSTEDPEGDLEETLETASDVVFVVLEGHCSSHPSESTESDL